MRQIFIVLSVLVFLFCIINDVYSDGNHVQILGENFRVVNSDNQSRTYEIVFSIRNNTDKHIIQSCYIPHLYNRFGEMFQLINPGESIQFCNSIQIPPGGIEEFTIQLPDYSGVATRCDVESVFFLLSD